MIVHDEERAAVHALADAVAAGPGQLDTLRARLAAAAAGEGLLDVAYRTLDTPVGSLLLAATGQGLLRVAYSSQNHQLVLQDLANRVSPRVLRAPARLDAVAAQIEEYFTGRRTRFELPLDWRLAGGFRAKVLHLLSTAVPFGHTASYADLARLAGSPRAVRAVGSACASNPLPLVVPCHRIVRSDGSLSGYAGGASVKQALLTLEAGGRR